MTTSRRTTEETLPATGLDDVVAARTRLSRVEGEAGRLTIAGYPVEAIAPRLSFEEVVHLLWHDQVPDARERRDLEAELRRAAELPGTVVDLLRSAAASGALPMDALRVGVAALALRDVEPVALVGALPAVVAAHWRLLHGREPLPPREDLALAGNYLYLLRGEAPRPEESRGLETYLNTVVDHGMNASTFTARVITSTASDLGSAIEGALGALKGPLHGGAPGPALAALQALRSKGEGLDERTREWVRTTVRDGGRVMGFGHRVYRVRDPRADVLLAAARDLLDGTGLYGDALVFERAVLETLEELKPGRRLQTNVEFATALLLHGLGLDERLFTPTFAVGRAVGWVAHVEEQRREGRLMRPRAQYVGPEGRTLPG
ncbi:MAG: citrate/2-methylcitrate synthase [Planctomycetota bacterium]